MLTKPSIESLLPKVDSRYTLAILVAKRARQIVIGGKVLVPVDSPNTVTQACEELAADRVTFVRGDLPIVHNREQFAYGVYVELRPDVIDARMQQLDPESRSADLNDDLGEDLDLAAPVAVEATEADAEAVAEVIVEASEMIADAVADAAVDAAPEAVSEEDPA